MTSIRRFEEIDAWQKARLLTKSIYKCSSQNRFAKDYGLCDQIRRAAVSIMSNIAEGFGRGGNKELVHFLSTARGSVSELQSQLYVALDADYITADQFKQLYTKAQETGRLISGFTRYLNRSAMKGSKFSKT
jgi:four helix bundle protein